MIMEHFVKECVLEWIDVNYSDKVWLMDVCVDVAECEV